MSRAESSDAAQAGTPEGIRLAMIAAHADNLVIGRDNGLPWHLPEDLRHFKQVTLGKPVIMGRRTHESIGRPLPGRDNIVVTRNAAYSAPGAILAATPTEGLEMAIERACAQGQEEVLVMGGEQLYRHFLPQARRLYLTLVHSRPEGDAWFPRWQAQDWLELSRETHPARESQRPGYSFVVLERP